MKIVGNGQGLIEKKIKTVKSKPMFPKRTNLKRNTLAILQNKLKNTKNSQIRVIQDNHLLNDLLDISHSETNSRDKSIEQYANKELNKDIEFYPTDESNQYVYNHPQKTQPNFYKNEQNSRNYV